MVEIIPKPTTKVPLWQNILLYFSLILLLGAISSYFILDKYQKEAQGTIQDLQIILSKEKTTEESNLEKEVLSLQRKIRDFSKLLEVHQKKSNILKIIEAICHPKVWFSEFTFSSQGGRVTLEGETDGFQTLGQQLIIFQSDKRIKEVDLKDLSIGEKGKVEFTLDLSFDPQIFK